MKASIFLPNFKSGLKRQRAQVNALEAMLKWATKEIDFETARARAHDFIEFRGDWREEDLEWMRARYLEAFDVLARGGEYRIRFGN